MPYPPDVKDSLIIKDLLRIATRKHMKTNGKFISYVLKNIEIRHGPVEFKTPEGTWVKPKDIRFLDLERITTRRHRHHEGIQASLNDAKANHICTALPMKTFCRITRRDQMVRERDTRLNIIVPQCLREINNKFPNHYEFSTETGNCLEERCMRRVQVEVPVPRGSDATTDIVMIEYQYKVPYRQKVIIDGIVDFYELSSTSKFGVFGKRTPKQLLEGTYFSPGFSTTAPGPTAISYEVQGDCFFGTNIETEVYSNFISAPLTVNSGLISYS